MHGAPEEARAASVWERAALPLTGLTAAAFGALSALRRNRVFHPVGEAFTGTVTFRDGARDVLPLDLFSATPQDAVIRFSRGIGLPEPAPDVLGLGIKIIDAAGEGNEQDLLLASSGTAPVARNLLVPSTSFFKAAYSSVLPYRVRNEQVVFGARADVQTQLDGHFGDVRSLAARAQLAFDLLVARLASPWSVVGRLVVTGICPQEVARDLRFNPWNTRAELQPAGPLNTLRNRAYKSSQAARPS